MRKRRTPWREQRRHQLGRALRGGVKDSVATADVGLHRVLQTGAVRSDSWWRSQGRPQSR